MMRDGDHAERMRSAFQIGARRSLLSCVAACTISCACTPPSERTEFVAPRVLEALELSPSDAEVWAWHVEVRATAKVTERLSACQFQSERGEVSGEVVAHTARARIALAPGENTVQVRCRSGAVRELTSRPVRYVAKLRDAPRALAQAVIRHDKLVLNGSRTTTSEYSRAKITNYVWSEINAFGSATKPVGNGVALSIPLSQLTSSRDDERRYELRVIDERRQTDRARLRVSVRNGVLEVANATDVAPWLRGSVVYGVVPPFFGTPALRSVRAALPELSELGVNTLWLSPIFGTLPGDFGYAVTDYFRVRPDYGTAEDLRELVREAHRLRLRVLLDLVPNHTSRQHPYFEQSEALGNRSHYFGFFQRDQAQKPVHYFDWEHLPNLDYDEQEVVRFMTEVPAHWVRHFAIDGYRVDVAWGVRERKPEFWPALQRELRRLEPETLLLAEASARDPYYLKSGFDAAYDWTHELGHWAWEKVFDSPKGIATRLDAALRKTAERTHPERVFRFLNNNDTGDRFITRYGEPLTRVATALLLTLPGVPCVYNFDELGAEFQPYAGLQPIKRPARGELWTWHRDLIRLRRTQRALNAAGFATLHVSETDDAYVYLRSDEQADEHALVALNFGPEQLTRRVTLPAAVRAQRFRNALGTEELVARGQALSITLEPYAAAVYVMTRANAAR